VLGALVCPRTKPWYALVLCTLRLLRLVAHVQSSAALIQSGWQAVPSRNDAAPTLSARKLRENGRPAIKRERLARPAVFSTFERTRWIAKYMPACVGSALEVPPRPSSAQLALSQEPTTCPLLWAATLARLDLHARVAPPCLSHALPDGSAPHPAKQIGVNARVPALPAISAPREAQKTHRASAVSHCPPITLTQSARLRGQLCVSLF
jgi:hypothetical protein